MNELLPVAPDVEQMATTVTHDGFDASQIESDVSELELETEYYCKLADEMLRKIVAENRKPSFAEQNFFKGRCGWSDIEINYQMRRMRESLRHQSVIGTASQREAIDDENKKAREVLESEKPKLLKKLAAIQEQINDLDRAATSAERRVEQVENALSELAKPELLRADLLAKYNGLVQHFGDTTGQEMGELGVEIQHFEILLERPENCSVQHWLESVQRFDPSCCNRTEDNRRVLHIIEPNWTLRKESMISELEAMRRTFKQLQTAKAEHVAKLAEIATHYIRENN